MRDFFTLPCVRSCSKLNLLKDVAGPRIEVQRRACPAELRDQAKSQGVAVLLKVLRWRVRCILHEADPGVR